MIMYLAATCISTIMGLIYDATSGSGTGSIGSSMFCIFAEEAYDGGGGDKEAVLESFRTGERDYQ